MDMDKSKVTQAVTWNYLLNFAIRLLAKWRRCFMFPSTRNGIESSFRLKFSYSGVHLIARLAAGLH